MSLRVEVGHVKFADLNVNYRFILRLCQYLPHTHTETDSRRMGSPAKEGEGREGSEGKGKERERGDLSHALVRKCPVLKYPQIFSCRIQLI